METAGGFLKCLCPLPYKVGSATGADLDLILSVLIAKLPLTAGWTFPHYIHLCLPFLVASRKINKKERTNNAHIKNMENTKGLTKLHDDVEMLVLAEVRV